MGQNVRRFFPLEKQEIVVDDVLHWANNNATKEAPRSRIEGELWTLGRAVLKYTHDALIHIAFDSGLGDARCKDATFGVDDVAQHLCFQ